MSLLRSKTAIDRKYPITKETYFRVRHWSISIKEKSIQNKFKLNLQEKSINVLLYFITENVKLYEDIFLNIRYRILGKYSQKVR